MLADYHTHHYRCGHATGQMDDYVEAAIEAGIDEIGLSDHSPIYHFEGDPHPRPLGAMAQAELPVYIDDLQRVRARFADRISIRIGAISPARAASSPRSRAAKHWLTAPIGVESQFAGSDPPRPSSTVLALRDFVMAVREGGQARPARISRWILASRFASISLTSETPVLAGSPANCASLTLTAFMALVSAAFSGAYRAAS